MVRRGAHERQADGHVDRPVEIQRLDRDQRLIVIHADGGVVGGTRLGVEHRVAGHRAGDVEPLGTQQGDRGGNDLHLLAADGPAFAGVRV